MSLYYRLYSDYFLPNRLSEYETFINEGLKGGYSFYSVLDYYELFVKTNIPPQKAIVLRHDVDTDTETAKLFYQIEKKYDIRSTYYFRLKTLDIKFMKLLNEYGSEASYHFEEISDYAKKYGIRNKVEVLEKMEEIQEVFKANFLFIESSLGYKIKTVCSHGDFVNRRLGLVNSVLLNKKLRSELSIELEAYDEVFMNTVSSRHSDTIAPLYYIPCSPIEAILQNSNVIYFLTHPRHWRRSFIVNTKDNLTRLYEGIIYDFS